MAVQLPRFWDTFQLRRSGLFNRLRILRVWARILERYHFSSITRRIVFLNSFALALLVAGLMYLNQSEGDLVQARMQTLATQAEIIAGAIGKTSDTQMSGVGDWEGATVTLPARRMFDPELSRLSFRINPEFVAPMLRDLVGPTKTRARIYDSEGVLLLDSLKLYARGQVSRIDLPSFVQPEPGILDRVVQFFRSQVALSQLPAYRDGGMDGRVYDEVRIALGGAPSQIIRVTENGNRVMNVAAPIQRSRTTLGVLLLTTEGSDIDEAIATQRWQIVYLALLVIAVTVVLSLLLAGTIAGPMRRLAQSAERVRRNIKAREQIPDYTHRRDEIGHLSGALRDMTNALYVRMDAIENFAADVSHELKNPLTSLRNAAGMLPYVKSENDRNKLLDIIQHDVRRLDRLITDISDASRLDAELARETGRAVNVAHLLDTLCKITNDTRCGSKHAVVLRIEGNTPGVAAASGSAWGDYVIHGHDSRLSQVISNLLDNALSFSPPGGKIHVAARLLPKTREVEILIEDEGPGIRPENLERIFDRFYTDRPEHEAFGQNSGLGLHISRQIVQAHGGRIWAENRSSPAFGSNRRKRRGMQHMPQFQSSFSRHGAARNGDLALLEPEVSEGERHGFGARFVIRLPSGPASRR